MALTPEQQAELDAMVAADKAAVPQNTLNPNQQSELDALVAADQDTGPSMGEQAMDVARVVGGANRAGAEFTADVSRLPLTYLERTRQAKKGFQEGEGFLGSMGGYLGGLFGETDYDRQQNEALFGSISQPDLYKEQIGEGEGGALLDTIKTGAKIGTDLATGAWMGGAKAAPMVMKSIPTSIGLGLAGEQVGGDLGEAAGVITGALTGGPVETAKLLARLPGMIAKAPVALGKKVLGVDATVDTASPRQIGKALDNYIRNAFPDLPPEQLQDYVKQLTPKIEAAVREGKKGTVGQLADDPGLLTFEKEMTNVNQAATRREDVAKLNEINRSIHDETMAPMDAIEGVTKEAGDVPATLVKTMQREADTAKDVVADATAPFVSDAAASTTASSTALKNTMQGKADEAYQGVKDTWAAMPEGTVTPKKVNDSLKAFYKDIGPNATNSFKKSFPDVASLITGLKGKVTMDDISDILSAFSAKTQQIKQGGSSGVALKPERMKAFKQAIYDAMDSGVEGASEARTAAAKASRDFFETYGPDTRLGKALDDKAGKEFASSYLGAGDAGAARADEILAAGGDDAAKNVDDFLTSQLGAKADEGVIKPTDVDSFSRRNREQLSPDMQAKVDTLRDTGRASEVAEQAATDIDKSVVGSFGRQAGDEEMLLKQARKVMSGGTSSKNRTKELTTLMDSVGDNPAARDNLRRTFMDDFVNSVSDDGQLTQDSYEAFKRNRKVYEDAGVFSKQELDTIESSLQEGQKMFLHQDAARLAKLPPEKRRVLEMMSAIGGAKLGAAAFGSPLIGAAIGKKASKEIVEQMTNKQARQLAYELATNPDKFVEQVNLLKKGDLSNTEMTGVIKAMMNVMGTGAADMVESTLKGVPKTIPAVVSQVRE